MDDTLKALEASACDVLIVYENLEITRWVFKNSAGAEVVLHTNKEQQANTKDLFMDKETGADMELVEQGSFLEWLAEVRVFQFKLFLLYNSECCLDMSPEEAFPYHQLERAILMWSTSLALQRVRCDARIRQ